MPDCERIERLGVRSDPGLFRDVRRWLNGILAGAGWLEEERSDLVVALSEACSNAHRYAYEGRKSGRIDLQVELSADGVEIRVRDYGKGFDPRDYRAPELGRPREGGYGIYLMKRLTDRLEHRSMETGTLVLMTKRRRTSVACACAAGSGERDGE